MRRNIGKRRFFKDFPLTIILGDFPQNFFEIWFPTTKRNKFNPPLNIRDESITESFEDFFIGIRIITFGVRVLITKFQ